MHCLRHCVPFPLLVAGLLAQVQSEVEPNDSQATANATACGVHVEAAIGVAGDQDWYTFTLAQPALVTAVINPGPDGANTDTIVSMFDSAGAMLGQNDDENRVWLSVLQLDLAAGTYAVRVRHFGAAGTGTYSLDLQCGPAGGGLVDVQEASEPNGPIGNGTPSTIACGQRGVGTLGTGDSDWWTFTLATRALIRAETGIGLSGTSSLDTILYVRDQAGAQLAFDDDSAPGNWSMILMVLSPGTYHLDVQGYAGANAGTYTLALTCTDASNALPELAEPNGNPNQGGSPSVTACGLMVEGEIFPGGDSDWYILIVTGDTFLLAENWPGGLTPNGGPIGDPLVRLYDSGFQQIASDDDSGPNLLSRMQTFIPAGTYYLEMVGFGTATGSYLMTLRCNGGAQVQMFAGTACPGTGNTLPGYQVRPYEMPLVGTTFVADFFQTPANAAVIAVMGFDRTRSGSGLPLPFDLSPFGAPGCLIAIDPVATNLLFAGANGRASWALPIPMVPAIAGTFFGQQGVVLDATANTLGLTTTDWAFGLTGMRL
ncbi:MAG: DVUA0089 family protein [Planctomycetes bacterium]|nr:DVUA0089 family protein [Planctomycetota bacterium]